MKKISEVPMLVDEKEVEVNAIFYRALGKNMGSCYKKSFQGRGEVEIEPWRVITVNNTHRHFRVRNIKGCEEEWSLKDGCICGNLKATLDAARKDAFKMFQDDIDEHNSRIARIDKIKESKKELVAKQRKCKALKVVKLPKKV